MNAWPTPEEESAKTWRHMSLIAQIVFFVLTIVAIVALYAFSTLLQLPAGVIVLVASIVLAEVLIWRAHFWRTGLESALWLGGLYAFVFSLPSSGKPEAILVLAAAAALAGWRVRNPLFGALASTMIVAYFAAREIHWMALFFAIAIALIALIGLTHEWKRPSTEMLWQILALVMPVAGYVAIVVRNQHRFTTDGRIVAIFLGLAAVFTIVGIRQRLRIPLIAAAINIAIAIVEAHDYVPVSVEAELIIIGAIAMIAAAAILRSLREKKVGFVLGVPKQSDLRDVLSVAPTLLSVHAAEGGAPQQTGGGGEFGGAGSSGDY